MDVSYIGLVRYNRFLQYSFRIWNKGKEFMDLPTIKKVVYNAEYFSGVFHILEKGEILLNVAAGFAKREDEIPNNVDTAFGIASGTKGFTALGILRLVDQGKLSLEDTVFEKLPYDYPNMDKTITVRHLLTHTSGIYDYFDEEVVDNFRQLFDIVPIHRILGPKDMLPLLVDGKAYFKPGEKFKYCNSGFVILGMLIEIISGMGYGDYIQKELCEPLMLNRTGCYITNCLPKNCALGYIQDEKGAWYSNIFDIPIACTADGGLFTSASDITRMWQQVFSGNFISQALLSEVFTVQADVDGNWGDNLHYGLGFWIQHDKEGKVSNYFLLGEDPGVSFISKYYIEEDRIITILANNSEAAEKLLNGISPYL